VHADATLPILAEVCEMSAMVRYLFGVAEFGRTVLQDGVVSLDGHFVGIWGSIVVGVVVVSLKSASQDLKVTFSSWWAEQA